MANKVIKSGGRVRRELANYILISSSTELLRVICALETDNDIPDVFSCELCKKTFGECIDNLDTKLCEDRLEQYDKLSYTQSKEA